MIQNLSKSAIFGFFAERFRKWIEIWTSITRILYFPKNWSKFRFFGNLARLDALQTQNRKIWIFVVNEIMMRFFCGKLFKKKAIFEGTGVPLLYKPQSSLKIVKIWKFWDNSGRKDEKLTVNWKNVWFPLKNTLTILKHNFFSSIASISREISPLRLKNRNLALKTKKEVLNHFFHMFQIDIHTVFSLNYNKIAEKSLKN